MHRTLGTTTRRSLVQGGLLASLAMVVSLGALPIPDVAASKNDGRKPKSVKSRVQAQRDLCEIGGGNLTVESPSANTDGSTDTTCKGGFGDGWSCINRPGEPTHCWQAVTHPDVPTQPLEPAPPTAGPGDVPDVPLDPDGGGVTITAYTGDRQYAKVKRHKHSH